MYWDKLSHKQIKERIKGALEQNLNFKEGNIMGLPGTFLDPEVFYGDAPFLGDAPFMQTLIANPNHIGCHTLGESEPAFPGTQAIERELIDICAQQIFSASPDSYDGYVASGGTEANIEALWVLRNYYQRNHQAQLQEIAVIYSADTHYSIPKGTNLLSLQSIIVPVDDNGRNINLLAMHEQVLKAKPAGIRFFILIQNMSTTMFGSVDDVDASISVMDKADVEYHIHVDAAYGGFIYPFTRTDEALTFKNEKIVSFSLDAHKLVQSPYGTGICLLRKGMIQYALTDEAHYVKGKDYTLAGSRSGANAIAVWMILMTYGYLGWQAKIQKLVDRTDRICENLDDRSIRYYRHSAMNIVSIRAEDIPLSVAQQFLLVPDSHDGKAKWMKIVVMEHVSQGKIDKFFLAIDTLNGQKAQQT